MITMHWQGHWDKLFKSLEKSSKMTTRLTNILTKYARAGVEELKKATPVQSGKTADSWSYEIDLSSSEKASITFKNSNINQNVNIAILIQYGHGTGYGGYVEGVDYINPALAPIFEKLVTSLEREVRKIW